MSLWDLIRDFFVQHVFGGLLSNGVQVGGYVGTLIYGDYYYSEAFTTDYYVSLGGYFQGNDAEVLAISLGDWLSTTATIISITIIVVLCCLFVYKIVKLIGGLIR